jgi:DegV family protein with EDD domain
MVKILTDSTCDLPPEVFERYGITVIPLRVHFGTESFLDGVTISKEEFFNRLPKEAQLPTTSQPSAGDFCEAVKPLVDAGHEVVGIFISGDLSGTVASAHASCELMPDAKFTVVDPGTTSAGLGWLVWEAARMADEGADSQSIVSRVQELSEKVRLYFVVDTLEYLQKGGRIGGARALLGTMLSIKPLLMIEEGKVDSLEQVRTRRKALQRMIDLMAEQMSGYSKVKLAILHARVEDEAKQVLERVRVAIPAVEESFIAEIGPVLGTHAGPGVIGIAAFGE